MPARWWGEVPGTAQVDGHVACRLCPHGCALAEGKVGRCGARYAQGGRLFTRAWGVGTPPVADPVEKKPLYHFLPGSRVLSFGLPGCNMACSFCQNWGLSTSGDYDQFPPLTADDCVALSRTLGCRSIAFTYSEPSIAAEFCIDVADAGRGAGLRTVAVSNGYICGDARGDFFGGMDAANIDLKSIDTGFYEKHCGARLEPVLETLVHVAREKRVWLEVTNLLIPSLNDSDKSIGGLIDWVAANLGPDVPLHFSAFHPAHRMQGLPRTPLATLARARDMALAAGLRYAYAGNTPQAQVTLCPKCQTELIRRDGFSVECGLRGGRCPACGGGVAGVFDL
jgi:pyruvate formate lyase activating enzyme